MLFNPVALAALAGAASIAAQQISAADMVSNINRLTTLTRIATAVTQYVVYVDNPLVNRNDTIVAIDSIGTQGILDQDLMTGQACGALTKRYSGSIASRAILGKRQESTYTSEEQANVSDAYTTVSHSIVTCLLYHVLMCPACQRFARFHGRLRRPARCRCRSRRGPPDGTGS